MSIGPDKFSRKCTLNYTCKCLLVTIALLFSACEVQIVDGSVSDSSSSATASTAIPEPTLSYSGSTGNSISLGSLMLVIPSTLQAGDSNATISKCEVKSGSTNASSFPSTLTIQPKTCVITGTPTAGFAATTFTIKATNTLGGSTSAQVTLAVTAPADHLVLVSGNNQTAQIGSSISNLQVQVVDQWGSPYTSGVSLQLTRMLGFFSGPAAPITVTTNGSGIASFPVKLGYSPDHWQVSKVGASLPDLALSGGTKILFKTTPTTLGNGTFAGQSVIGAGGQPGSVTVGDFDADGKFDFVVGNIADGTISFYKGNGNGTFQARQNTSVGASPYDINSADLNGDGKLDVIVSNATSKVSVLLGNGNGTFQPQVQYAANGTTTHQAIADFNGDGKLDMIVVNTNNTLSVFLGNGDGTFQSQTSFGTGANLGGVAAADFNGDGKLDIAVSTFSGAGIYLGVGNGTFTGPTYFGVGVQASRLAVGDFNSDGNIDLVVPNYGASNVSVLLGNGNGAFQAQVLYTTGGSPERVVVADFNGDGKLDIASANVNGDNMSILLGVGNGTFLAHSTYACGDLAMGIGVADFNGDGKLDAAVSNYNAFSISILIGN